MRRSIGFTAVMAIGLVAPSSGCQTLFGDSRTSGLVGEDAGSCDKDREVLSQLLTQPQSCTSTENCPVGSYCESGQCTWDCYTDSDCGFGNSCTCDGRCLAGGTPDGGPGSDPECPRSLAVLLPDGGALDRTCMRDDQCPYGSRCDEVTARCVFDCTSDGECTPPEVCTCLGECAEPNPPCASAAIDVVDEKAAFVAVAPAYMPVHSSYEWGPQTFSITVNSPAGVPFGFQPRAYVEILGAIVQDPGVPEPPPTDARLGAVTHPTPSDRGQKVSLFRGVPMSDKEELAGLTWVNAASQADLQTYLGLGTTQAQEVAAATFTDLADFASLDYVDSVVMQALKSQGDTGQTVTCNGTLTLDMAQWVVDTTRGCAAGELRCASGECIARADVCDGTEECSGGDDEAWCGQGTCLDTEFGCADGTCLAASKRCDGVFDCATREDEATCGPGYTATASFLIGRCGVTPAGDSWDVAISTYLEDTVTTPGKKILLARDRVMLGTEHTPGEPGEGSQVGEFEGELVEQDVIAGEPLVVPVKAWATQLGQMVIFDENKLLSASGRFDLSTPETTSTYFPVIDRTCSDEAMLSARVNWPGHESTNGALRGEVEIRIGTFDSNSLPRTFAYRLRRTAALRPLRLCNECLEDEECNPRLNRCLPDVMDVMALENNVCHETESAWRSGAAFFSGTNGIASIRQKVGSLICYDYPAEEEEPIGGFFSSSVEPLTGELSCLAEMAGMDPMLFYLDQTTSGLVTAGDDIPDHPATLPTTAAGWLAACLADLARIPGDPGDPPIEQQALTWFGEPGPCINLSQIIPALGWLAQGSTTGDLASFTMDTARAVLYQRLLAQWLDVHAFVFRQGTSERDAQDALEAAAVAGEEWADIDLSELLDVAASAWDLLLDPTYSRTLRRLQRADLREPDYRVPRPWLYWPFLDPASSTDGRLVDAAGDRHATLSGTGFTRTQTDCESYVRLGYGNYASYYSGVSNTDSFNLMGDVTLSFWARFNTYPPLSQHKYAFLFYQWSGNPDSRISLRLDHYGGLGDDNWTIQVYDGAAYQGFPAQYDNGWVHLVAVRTNARDWRLYLNGQVLTCSGAPCVISAIYDPSAYASGTGFIGDYGGSSGYAFDLDEVAIWPQALSDDEIASLYATGRSNGSSPSCSAGHSRHLVLDAVTSWAPEANVNHEQGTGLPVKILDAATQHARLVDAYAVRRNAELHDECASGTTSQPHEDAVSRASAALRQLDAVYDLARQLHLKSGEHPCALTADCPAGTTCPATGTPRYCEASGARYFNPPPWNDRYVAGLEEFTAARGKARKALQDLVTCRSPLGFSNDEVPLYFGDVAGDNSQAFASSDYLLDRWATPTVQQAAAALAVARDAGLNQRNSNIQQVMTEQERERRLEAIERSAAEEVMAACGITEYGALDVLDAFDSGALSLAECFRKPGCTASNRACLRGNIGAGIIALAIAEEQLDVALHDASIVFEVWRAQVESCERLAASIGEADELFAAYKATMDLMRERSGGLLGLGVRWAIGKIVDLLPGGVGIDVEATIDAVTDTVKGCIGGALGGNAAAGCVLGLLGSDLGAEQGMQEAGESLQALLTILQMHQSLEACTQSINEAFGRYMQQTIRIRSAELGIEQAGLALDETIRGAQRALQEGRGALAREENRTVPSVAHHYWMDEKVRRFRTEFTRAQRFTYLALLAMEYEFQQSFGLRSEILTSTHPDSLLDVIYVMESQRGTRTINGRRPSGGTEVLSLRSDILAIADLDAFAPGEREMSAAARLQEQLTDPRNAVYANDGSYIGQGIRFNLSEQGALRLRCAERLWRVSATIQGDVTTTDAPGTYVLLLKRNTFASQWCDGLGDGESDYQVASTFGTNMFAPELTNEDATREYTTAMLFPWYNVRRSDLYQEAYAEGASDELAGRGLYGEYMLLFPYHGMLAPPPGCAMTCDSDCADIFRDLDDVEDVLLRFDYVSVDNLSL